MPNYRTVLFFAALGLFLLLRFVSHLFKKKKKKVEHQYFRSGELNPWSAGQIHPSAVCHTAGGMPLKWVGSQWLSWTCMLNQACRAG